MTQIIRSLFDRIVRWFTLSSANPAEVGMTMKAAFVAVVPTLMLVIGMAHWNIGQDQLTQLFDGIVAVVQDALILVAAVVAVVGFARKLILSVQGQNQVNQVPLVVPTQLGAPPSNLPGGQA